LALNPRRETKTVRHPGKTAQDRLPPDKRDRVKRHADRNADPGRTSLAENGGMYPRPASPLAGNVPTR
jgi:hypothetical protein